MSCKGKNNPNWKGGRKKRMGYVYILFPRHPDSNYNGYIKRCNLIMEKKIGRRLTKRELVHHINEIKNDDSPKNLQLMTIAEHTKHHKPHLLMTKIQINFEELIGKEEIHIMELYSRIMDKYNVDIGTAAKKVKEQKDKFNIVEIGNRKIISLKDIGGNI